MSLAPLRTLRLFLFSLLLYQCRDHEKTDASHAIPTDEIDMPILSLYGDTREQIWTWQQHGANGIEIASTLRIKRNRGGGHLLSFPEKLSHHQCQYREGNATYTLTTAYLPQERVLIQRMKCDIPGEINLALRLTPTSEIRVSPIQNGLDRQIRHASIPRSQCWLLPFESEVDVQGDELRVSGEGELLILWHIPENAGNLASDWKTLLHRFVDHPSEPVDLNQLADRLEQSAKESTKSK
ncbi:MAG: hypothetical protein RLZZ224_1469 [Verrucomicrobiota bacterium]|jgi:hypothetical protein